MSRHGPLEWWGVALALSMGAVYGVWIGFVQASPDRLGLPLALAAGLFYLIPGLVGVLGLAARSIRLRRGAFASAGILALLWSLTSLAGATLPLALPAILLSLAAVFARPKERVSA